MTDMEKARLIEMGENVDLRLMEMRFQLMRDALGRFGYGDVAGATAEVDATMQFIIKPTAVPSQEGR